HTRRRVVDENEIEVGTSRHLATAELAHSDDCELSTLNPTCGAGKLRFHDGKKARDHAFGDIRESRSRLFRLGSAFDDLHADAKRLPLREPPRHVERALVAESCLERTIELPI